MKFLNIVFVSLFALLVVSLNSATAEQGCLTTKELSRIPNMVKGMKTEPIGIYSTAITGVLQGYHTDNLEINMQFADTQLETYVVKRLCSAIQNSHSPVLEKDKSLELLKGIYAYRQKIIKRFSNLSFFIASPKLFALMDDTTSSIPGKTPIIQVNINGKNLELVRLGDIADVKRGIDTGDNKICLRKRESASGSLYQIDKKLLVTSDDIRKIGLFSSLSI